MRRAEREAAAEFRRNDLACQYYAPKRFFEIVWMPRAISARQDWLRANSTAAAVAATSLDDR